MRRIGILYRPALGAVALALGLLAPAAQAVAKSMCLIEPKECEARFKPRNRNTLAAMQMTDAEAERLSLAELVATAKVLVVVYDRFEGLQAKADARCKQGAAATSLKGFKPLYVTGQGDHKRALMMRAKSECAWTRVN